MGQFGRNLKKLLRAGVDTIYPRVCCVCHRSLTAGEEVICLHCLDRLPRTFAHRSSFNTIHKRLAGHVLVDRAAAWFHYYRGSEFAALIHDAKYHSMPETGRKSAAIFASEIAADGFFEGIDLILPVPMHKLKLLSRGYNQSYMIAKGLRDVTGINIGANLIALRGHSTQTHKNAWHRLLNARNLYAVEDADEIDGKHLLIVDDVVTTGATLLACIEAVHEAAPAARISVLVLAATGLR